MSDNPHLRFALPDHRVLVLEGPDAARFAQAQFMNDVDALAPGHWQWNGWLSAKGRVIALFALLKLDPQQLWLLLPDADPGELAAQLQRFVFRSKLALAPRPDLAVSGAFAAPASAGPRMACADDGSVALDFGGAGGARTLGIGPAGATAPADPTALAAWREFDLVHGLPRLEAGQGDRWTPQQLSLQRLRAFSVKKGCYPGQEIVARTHFLGQAKRGLLLLAADAPLAAGTRLVQEAGRAADIVATADVDGRHRVLAVGPHPPGDAPWATAGACLMPEPLAEGLAR